MRENIYKTVYLTRDMFSKELLQLNNKKTNDPVKKTIKNMNRHFSKRIYKWAINTWIMLSVIVREMQTTLRYRFTSTKMLLPLLVLSRFGHVRLCPTPQTAAHQAPPSLGFSRQEHWSGLPFSSPMNESEKWKWRHSVVSDSSRPHGLQPTRLLRPWDFQGKRTGVGCHGLLPTKMTIIENIENQCWQGMQGNWNIRSLLMKM